MTRGVDRGVRPRDADLKGFVAGGARERAALRVETVRDVPIHLAFSYDEEVGCRGVRGVIDRLATGARQAAGLRDRRTHPHAGGDRAQGQARVPLLREGARGTFGADAPGRQRGGFRGGTRDVPAPHRERSSQPMASVTPNSMPPYTTVHTGTFNGGIALNVVPDGAQVEFEIRNLPAENPDAIVRSVRAYADNNLVTAMRETFDGSAVE